MLVGRGYSADSTVSIIRYHTFSVAAKGSSDQGGLQENAQATSTSDPRGNAKRSIKIETQLEPI